MHVSCLSVCPDERTTYSSLSDAGPVVQLRYNPLQLLLQGSSSGTLLLRRHRQCQDPFLQHGPQVGSCLPGLDGGDIIRLDGTCLGRI